MPPNQLDTDAVNLAKAIRQTESGGNFTAKGKSGEYGAYQFTEPTWNNYASKHGVNVRLTDATPEQQNEVAYKQIKEWKDQGYNPGQIASMWNSGKPDAYLDETYRGVNKHGVQYDVPAYAKSVAEAYQKIKAGSMPGADPNNPSSIANTSPVQLPPQQLPSQVPGTMNQEQKDAQEKALATTAGVVGSIFPGAELGKAIGRTVGGVGEAIKEKSFAPLRQAAQENRRSFSRVAGDVAQSVILPASMALPGAATALGRIGQSGLVGAGIGATGAVAKGGDAREALKQGLIGGTTGAALGVTGEVLNAVSKYLPERFARSFIRGADDETIKYATEKGLGSPKKMLQDSDKSLSQLGNELRSALSSKENSYVQKSGEEVFDRVAQQFPESGLTPQDVADNIKKLVPLKKNLVDKFVKGDITLLQLHDLNSDLGKTVYKTRLDQPEVRAGKDVGNEVYHAISDFLKEAAPESAKVFDDFSKEIPLNAALQKLTRRMGAAKTFDLNALMALMATMHLGPAGMASAFALEKAVTSPTVNLGIAGALSKVPQLAGLGKGLVPLAARGVTQLTTENKAQ